MAFVPSRNMKHTPFLLVCLMLLISIRVAAQDVGHTVNITLQGGRSVSGEVVMQNADIVILRDLTTGTRYQCLRNQILNVEEQTLTQNVETAQVKKPSQVVLLMQVAGGVTRTAIRHAALRIDADLMVGHGNVFQRNIFVGGGVGFTNVTLNGNRSWQFITLMAMTKLPLSQRRHAPYIGMHAGWAFAVGQKPYDLRGGLRAGLDVGYRWKMNSRSAFSLSLVGDMLQHRVNAAAMTIDNVDYIYDATRMAFGLGLRVGVEL